MNAARKKLVATCEASAWLSRRRNAETDWSTMDDEGIKTNIAAKPIFWAPA